MDPRLKPSRWLPAFLDFVSKVRVTSKETAEPQPLQLYEAQLRFLGEIFTGLDNDVHFFVALKARQLGASTIMLLLDIFWLSMYNGLQGALITDTSDNKEIMRQTLTQILEDLPAGYRIPIKKHNRTALILANGSRLQYMSAGQKKNASLGRSRGLNFVHACVPGETPVIGKDGLVKQIKDIRIGDEVLTHTGKKTRVIDAWSNENDKGDLIEVTPWLGQALRFTKNHHIPTQRGIVDAADLRQDDWLIMPVRKITGGTKEVKFPESYARPQHGGTVSAASGATVQLTEAFGFACGYYLAEGSVGRQHDGQPNCISFARHRNETSYGNRAAAGLEGLYSSRNIYDRKDCLTTAETFYGASLARWMVETFGTTDQKIIPDAVFDWGEDFCRGLLAGLVCGDGSKTVETVGFSKNKKRFPRLTRKGLPWGRPATGLTDPDKKFPLNRVSLSSTRSSIAMQARDLAASLGIGWGSMSRKAAGIFHGRNCKEQWTVSWCSDAAAKLREMMGLPAIPTSGRAWVKKYKIENGLVYLRIRKITGGIKCDRIYDITVEDDDHTFRTPFMSIGNSETGFWGDEEGLESLIRSLAEENPNRLYIFESTANGFNLFQKMYARGKKDPAQKSFFVGWWAKESYRLKRDSREFERWWGTNPKKTDLEVAKCAVVKEKYGVDIDEEQLAWYRAQLYDKSASTIAQELPWDETEAFQSSGSPFFSQKRLTDDMNLIAGKLAFKGYAYHLGQSFLETRFKKCEELAEVQLRIWEEPKQPARYVIGVDPAYGRSELADRSVVSVWRCFADKLVQVAEYATADPEARQVAWVMAHLAGCYRDCMINLETNGPGALVMQELRYLREQMTTGPLRAAAQSLDIAESLNNARWFLWSRQDVLSPTYQYNTKTTANEKARVYGSLRDEYNSEAAIIRSVPLLEEMQTLRQDGLKIEASGRNKDDRVMAAALANISWVQWVRPNMMAAQRYYNREMALEAEYEKRGSDVNNHIVANFFEVKKREREARLWASAMDSGYER